MEDTHTSNHSTKRACIVHHRSTHQQAKSQADDVEKYHRFFQETESSAIDTLKLEQALLDEHGIKLTSKEFTGAVLERLYCEPRIHVVNVQRGAAIVEYDILIGPYEVAVRMLNMDSVMSDELNECLGKGGFGNIVVLSDESEEFTSKRIKFQDRVCLNKLQDKGEEWYVYAYFPQVKKILLEYALARICSMLGVGPKIKRDIGFDLVCYRDCVEFFMEKCVPIQARIANYGWNEIDSIRLKHCVRVMHCHHFIHRDIKPANIVWSPYAGQYVLCDFGIGHVVAESVGFKSQTENNGTEGYMTKQLRQLDGKGLADLYYNDMYALELTVNKLTHIKLDSLIRQQLVNFRAPTKPTTRIMAFKALSKLLKGASLESIKTQSIPQETLQLAEATALIRTPKVQFLLNSLDTSFELQAILEEYQQKDPRAKILAQMVANSMTRLIVKQKYLEIQQFGKRVFPVNANYVKNKELMRLNNEMIRLPQEETRRWTLLAENLEDVLTNKPLLQKSTEDLLRKFMTQPVPPGRQQLYKRIDFLFRLRTGRIQSIYEQLQQVDEGTLCNVVNYLFAKGDHRTCYEVILRYGEGSEIKNHGWLLENLLIAYDYIGDRKLIQQQTIELELERTGMQIESWHLLKKINLLAIAFLYKNPKQCCELCFKYLNKLSRRNRRSLIAILVRSYQLQEKVQEAILWQKELIALLEQVFPTEQAAIFYANKKLLELREGIPSVALDGLINEGLLLAHEQKRKFGLRVGVLSLYNQVAGLLIRRGKYNEADFMLSAIEKSKVSYELGQMGYIAFYSKKVRLKYAMLKAAKQEASRQTLKRSLSELIRKVQPPLDSCKNGNKKVVDLLLAVSTAEFQLGNTQQAKRRFEEAICLGHHQQHNFVNILSIAYAFIGKYTLITRADLVRELLTFLADKLKPQSFNTDTRNRLLLDKLCFVVKYGRTFSLSGVIQQLIAETLCQLELTSEVGRGTLHKAAVRICEMGYHQDALTLFRAAPQPAVSNSKAVMAIATSEYYAGSSQRSIRLLLSLTDEQVNQSLPFSAQYLKILALNYCFQKDYHHASPRLQQAFIAYLQLRREVVLSYLHAYREEVAEHNYRQTYSNDLCQLLFLLKRIKSARVSNWNWIPKKVARQDSYYFNRFASSFTVSQPRIKLCECFAILRKRRQLVKGILAARQMTTLFTGLYIIMEKQKMWADHLLFSGEASKNCEESTLRALRQLKGQDPPVLKTTTEGILAVTLSKRVRLTALTIERQKGTLDASALKIVDNAKTELTKFKQNRGRY